MEKRTPLQQASWLIALHNAQWMKPELQTKLEIKIRAFLAEHNLELPKPLYHREVKTTSV